MKKTWIAHVLWATAMCFNAHAFSIGLQNNYPIRWQQRTVRFYLDSDATKDITTSADIDAVQKAVASWNNVTCSDFTLQQAGTVTHTNTILTTQDTDGKNVLAWIEDNRWNLGSYVLAVTTPVFDNNGRIIEADIAFNGYQTRWSTNLSQPADVESVTVHELGHFFGLNHVLGGENMAEPPTMAPYADPYGKTRDLTQDDQWGLCFLYPTGSYTCSQNNQCPKFLDTNDQGQEYYTGTSTCVSGRCGGSQSLPEGTLPIGATCSDPYECSEGLFCQPTNRGSLCTQTCTPGINARCPSGFRCLPYPQGTDGACISDGMVDNGGDTPPQPAPNPTPDPTPPTPPSPPTSTAADCACDQYLECESACACDPDCVCACDTTTACDSRCSCDPQCSSKKKGCATLPGDPSDTQNGALWAAVCAVLFAWRVTLAKRHQNR